MTNDESARPTPAPDDKRLAEIEAECKAAAKTWAEAAYASGAYPHPSGIREMDEADERAKAAFETTLTTALRAARAAGLQKAAEWQPIETAPAQRGVIVGAKVDSLWCEAFAYRDSNGEWRLNCYGMEAFPLHFKPTHWISAAILAQKDKPQ